MQAFNFLPLKLYRANRVMDLGDRWLTRIGEEMLLPDSQSVQDLEKLGAIEAVTAFTTEAQGHGGPGMTLCECMEAEECQEKSKGGILSSFLRRFGL